jgi:hypothetical protein
MIDIRANLNIFRVILKQNKSKIGKNTEGGNIIKLRQKKAKSDVDRKKQNWILTKNAQLRVEEKKIKKENTSQNK